MTKQEISLEAHLHAVREFQASVRSLISSAALEVDRAFHKEALEDGRPGTLRRYDRVYVALQELSSRVGSLPVRIPDDAVEIDPWDNPEYRQGPELEE